MSTHVQPTARWWRVKELAEAYGVSLACIYDLIETGQLPIHRFGPRRGAIRISDEDRIAWEMSRREGGKANVPQPKPMRRRVVKLEIFKARKKA